MPCRSTTKGTLGIGNNLKKDLLQPKIDEWIEKSEVCGKQGKCANVKFLMHILNTIWLMGQKEIEIKQTMLDRKLEMEVKK